MNNYFEAVVVITLVAYYIRYASECSNKNSNSNNNNNSKSLYLKLLLI